MKTEKQILAKIKKLRKLKDHLKTKKSKIDRNKDQECYDYYEWLSFVEHDKIMILKWVLN